MACVASYRSGPAFADRGEHWVGTWSAALHSPNPGPPGLTNTGFANQTLRQIVHTSVGGRSVRVRLSTFGAAALAVGAAHVAIREANAAIVPGTDRQLTFGGQPSVTVPPSAVVLSDPGGFGHHCDDCASGTFRLRESAAPQHGRRGRGKSYHLTGQWQSSNTRVCLSCLHDLHPRRLWNLFSEASDGQKRKSSLLRLA
jgi:hypothetical protein